VFVVCCWVWVENGLLTGGLPREGEYLGWEILVACRRVSKGGDANGTTDNCLGMAVLSSMVLAVCLIIGGVEKNPGPVVEVDSYVLGAAGIWSQDFNVNYVDVGTIIVVEA